MNDVRSRAEELLGRGSHTWLEVDSLLRDFCAELQRLEIENAQLRNGVIEPDWMKRVREGGCVPCGDETHSAGYGTVVLKLHSPGPTWARHSDDPPTR